MTEIVVLDFDHLCDLSRKVVRFKTMFCLIYRHFYTNLLTVKNTEMAEAVCKNWQEQSPEVYACLMDMLVK